MKKRKNPKEVNYSMRISSEQRRELGRISREMDIDMAEITRTANDLFIQQYDSMKNMKKGRR